MRNIFLRRFLALLMVLLTMCSSAFAMDIKAGETVSSTSKWINSDIIGAVDENTKVNLKDDFHTAVNLEWLLGDAQGQDAFSKAEKLLYDRKLEIVLGDAEIDPANADAIGLSSEWLAHDLQLVQTFSSLCGEWEYRNAYGAEPARPYLDAIKSISTMEDLAAYMINADGMNITGISLIDIGVANDPQDESMYMAALSPRDAFTLRSQDEYSYISSSGYALHFGVEKAVRYLLERLDYTENEIAGIVQNCYRFESRLADEMKDSFQQQTQQYAASCSRMTREEIIKLADGYPLQQQLEGLGLEEQTEFLVYETSYFQALDRLYQERYLEEIKAMLMVHTVLELMPLLDEEAYEMAEKIHDAISSVAKQSDETVAQEEPELADKDKDIAEFVFNNYLQTYLPGPMDQLYVAAHCDPELKADVRALIDDTVLNYREMLVEASWLSEGARNAAVEKLDHMVIRCVYPDEFVDYTGLTFKGCRNGEGGTLPQAVAAINRFHKQRNLDKAGQHVAREKWDMSEPYMSTTVCNAFYKPLENSINILAGIVTPEMYDTQMPVEKKLAMLGSIVGHEITHGFDTTGYKYDKNGHHNPWWSTEDVEAFDIRASKLIKYYNNITPYPGAFLYSGMTVSGEAIADMGGVKCMLSIAKKIPDFDYELFFKSYAELWRCACPFEEEKSQANQDPHPLNFLRTNVTLMQFEEFHQTFDIQPGDGMYLAPENRISVW